MGRTPQYCSKDGFNRGAWTSMEDKLLTDYVAAYGEGKWSNVAKKTGLKRCGKSCRLRWLNYLRPDIKRGNISHDEEELIVRLHKLLGNRWSLIAGRLPGRTDNEIKNYWNSTLAKKTHQFQFSLPKFNTKIDVPATPTSQPPALLTPASGSHDDQNPESTEPANRPSKDDEINLPDFLFDFNMEDFCHILDAPADYNNNNNSIYNNNDDNDNIKDGEIYWEGNDKCGDELINGSDFMSLVPFIESDQVMDWSEMA